MSDIAIRVENLSKLYCIGKAQERHDTLRDALVSAVRAPIERLHRGSATSNPDSEDTIWALKDVSFEVQRGEVVGVIGRNGAGKSTLLKILSRITEPTSGRAVINGRVGSLLEVGTGFHPELTGRENVYLSGAILGMKREEIDQKFDEIVDFSGVEKFIDTPIKRYSSGMQVRLAFAVAAHLDPEILLIDEVLAVGDAEFQKKCLGKMGEVASEGRTVLFVSHNLEAVQRLCLKAMLIDQGRLEKFGTDVQSIVKGYLYGRQKECLPAEWKNLGNEFDNPWFKPLRFCVSNNQGDSQSMPVSNDTEMWVQIEAEIGLMDPALTIGYAIYSEDGKLLFWSYQTDQEKERWPTLRKGRIVLRGRIPRRLLNEGLYRVELIGGLHFREWLFKPGGNVPRVYLRISGGLSDSPLWMSKRPGVLAPVLEWVEVR